MQVRLFNYKSIINSLAEEQVASLATPGMIIPVLLYS